MSDQAKITARVRGVHIEVEGDATAVKDAFAQIVGFFSGFVGETPSEAPAAAAIEETTSEGAPETPPVRRTRRVATRSPRATAPVPVAATPAAVREPAAPSAVTDPDVKPTVKVRAARYIRDHGPKAFSALAEEIKCCQGDLYRLAREDSWFSKDGPNLTLTDVGRSGAARI